MLERNLALLEPMEARQTLPLFPQLAVGEVARQPTTEATLEVLVVAWLASTLLMLQAVSLVKATQVETTLGQTPTQPELVAREVGVGAAQEHLGLSPPALAELLEGPPRMVSPVMAGTQQALPTSMLLSLAVVAVPELLMTEVVSVGAGTTTQGRGGAVPRILVMVEALATQASQVEQVGVGQ